MDHFRDTEPPARSPEPLWMLPGALIASELQFYSLLSSCTFKSVGFWQFWLAAKMRGKTLQRAIKLFGCH